ncbi:nucleoside monophosphate kinase [Patescibacteria group bacterium]|nr:nucleoside monophosphate kinase [Patescibacteria group bacterium]MCL5409343.1 nucleoside monophosphate kinase [Patescibacteria group bacterium]
MKILITGPQGSGKTTQAEILAKKYQLNFFGVGDQLRELASEDSNMGKAVKEALDKGELVDNQIVANLVKKTFNKEQYRSGFITDGYPRDKEQLDLYDPQFDVVIYLQMNDEQVQKRLLARGRNDDTPEDIAHRLRWYHQRTGQVLDIYRQQGKLIEVDGNQTIEQVTAEIEHKLKGFLNHE